MRGRQKRAILQVLAHPMTKTQICQEATRIDPHILLRDVWFIVRQLQKRNLVQCLNPSQGTGKIYCLTDWGRKVVAYAFDVKAPHLPADVPWKEYSLVVRAKTRRLVVLELGKFASLNLGEATAARVRKRLNQTYPIGLNPVMRTLRELCRIGVMKCIATTPKQQRRVYSLTKDGERIREQVLAFSKMPS